MSHAEPGVLEAARHSRAAGRCVEIELHSKEAFFQGSVRTCDLSVGKHVSRTDRVAKSYLPGGETGLLRQKIEGALECEIDLGHAESPEGAGRRIVRENGHSLDVDVSVGVRAARVSNRAVKDRSAEGGICAGVRHDARLIPDQPAFRIAAHAQVDGHRVPLDVHAHALRPAQRALDRPVGKPGKESGVVLNRLVFFSAEPSSHVCRDHAHFLRGKAERIRHVPPAVVHVLLPRENQDHSVPVRGIREGAFRLHECVVGERRLEAGMHDMRGRCNCLFRVPSFEREPGEHISLWMNCRGPGCKRGFG